jgi:hypothetical protein
VDSDLSPEERKRQKKLSKAFDQVERDIDDQFKFLMETEGFPLDELEGLRWDYRLDAAADAGLTREELEYFVAKKEAELSGAEPPKPLGAKGAAAPVAAASAASGEYVRKSDVDIALVEKYLERKGSRNVESELSSVYKQMFGEDLHIPERVELADYTPKATDTKPSTKVTKEEIFGLEGGAKPEEKKAEAAPAEAAPAAKQPSRAKGVALAWKKGVPEGPTRDEKWSIWNPFRFWVIPKRFAGKSVGRFYVIFIVNLVFFVAQFALLLIPFLLRLLVTGIRYIWRRFLKQRMVPKFQALKEKAAVPQGTPAEAEKKPSGAKSS